MKTVYGLCFYCYADGWFQTVVFRKPLDTLFFSIDHWRRDSVLKLTREELAHYLMDLMKDGTRLGTPEAWIAFNELFTVSVWPDIGSKTIKEQLKPAEFLLSFQNGE